MKSRCLLFLLAAIMPLCADSVFDLPELRVSPSPAQASRVTLPGGLRVLDFDVSPSGPTVALLVSNGAGARSVMLWSIGRSGLESALEIPSAFAARSIVWHPEGRGFFLAGPNGPRHVIMFHAMGARIGPREIYSSPLEIRRLIAAPRPFQKLEYNPKLPRPGPTYRLFFGVKAADGSYSIRSVTANGQRDYQVIGHANSVTHFPDAGEDPSNLTSASALPVAFHPAGHMLIWEDARNCFEAASYDRDHWSATNPLFGRRVCGGTMLPTPNGMATIHWTAGQPGIELLLQQGKSTRREAAALQFMSAPSSVPDGRGIVGVARDESGVVMHYVPIDVPLADSVNAWMFQESPEDTQHFEKHGGLFRKLTDMEQLYQLYDTESYACGGYDQSTPTRPYLVTTDALWEVFAAAYEGLFIVREREVAIPAFWQFVAQADQSLHQTSPQSRWTAVFDALAAVNTNAPSNAEAKRILQSTGNEMSPTLGVAFDYGELKPRGHYTTSPTNQKYFRAFRYLTGVSKLKSFDTAELRDIPPDVRAAALRWIDAYREMIAPSRAPVVWKDDAFQPPSYTKRPESKPVLFPLSWGFDNETLLSTVYHSTWPASEQITGASSVRLLPSSVDVAAALGSRFARDLLADEFAKYPNLQPVLDNLQSRAHAGSTLYDKWIEALAVQWADSTASPNGPLDERLWRVKRLQTGLASWATLRHATVLVNERTGAECGEAGFEEIILRAPRGYVEPDPATFASIAGLFDTAAQGPPISQRASLAQGVKRRLTESAAKARLFQALAEKEVRGEQLTSKDYEEILYFGRVAEHHFLVFKSLSIKDQALAHPRPVPKIADVSGGPPVSAYLHAAVGFPLEWDHVVPYFGRHQIVKGAAYSFYEFASPEIRNDEDWLKKAAAQPHPAWIAPHVSQSKLSCPPRSPF